MIPEKRRTDVRYFILAVCAGLLLAACGGGSDDGDAPAETTPPAVATVEGRVPTAADLTGIWLQVQNRGELGLMVQFFPNKTFAFDSLGELATDPSVRGSWVLEGDQMSFTSHGSEDCSDDDEWAWKTSVVEDGQLHIVHTEEGAGPCRVTVNTEWTLLRVTPRPHPTVRDFPAPSPAEGAPPTADDLPGIWMPLEAPGLLVRLSEDGSFAVDTGGNIAPNPEASVLGGYDLAGETITFTISGGHACDTPDGWTWEADLVEEGLLNIVYTTEARGQCRHEVGTEWTLIRLSPSSPVLEAIARTE